MIDKETELRNRVYDIVAALSVTEGKQCTLLPTLALAWCPRQLRAEYLPICKQAEGRVGWSKVTAYLNTFYPSIESETEGVEHAPAKLWIILDVHFFDKSGPFELDLHPFVKMKHANKSFRLRFTSIPGYRWPEVVAFTFSDQTNQ